jgi:hypothetical protein
MSENSNGKEKTAEELELEQNVEEDRITLVNDQDEEFDYIIIDEFDYKENHYLALAPCDEKTDMGGGSDPGESNDITVVREGEVGGEVTFFAVNDADELYALAKIIDDRFGHLSDTEVGHEE